MTITPRDRAGNQAFASVPMTEDEAYQVLMQGPVAWDDDGNDLYPADREGWAATGWAGKTYRKADLLKVAGDVIIPPPERWTGLRELLEAQRRTK